MRRETWNFAEHKSNQQCPYAAKLTATHYLVGPVPYLQLKEAAVSKSSNFVQLVNQVSVF